MKHISILFLCVFINTFFQTYAVGPFKKKLPQQKLSLDELHMFKKEVEALCQQSPQIVDGMELSNIFDRLSTLKGLQTQPETTKQLEQLEQRLNSLLFPQISTKRTPLWAQ